MLRGYKKLTLSGEVSGLRELVRNVRSEVAAMPCKCSEYRSGGLCRRCILIGMVDEGLAGIAGMREGEMDKKELIEKAEKQLEAIGMVVKEQKAKLLEAEESLKECQEKVEFLKKAVMVAVETSIDLQSVVEWLSDQESC